MSADLDIYENNLGFNLLRQGRRDEAVTLFEAALARRPRSEVARNNLATALASRKEGEIDTPAILAHWKSVIDPAVSANLNMEAEVTEHLSVSVGGLAWNSKLTNAFSVDLPRYTVVEWVASLNVYVP